MDSSIKIIINESRYYIWRGNYFWSYAICFEYESKLPSGLLFDNIKLILGEGKKKRKEKKSVISMHSPLWKNSACMLLLKDGNNVEERVISTWGKHSQKPKVVGHKRTSKAL